MKDDLELKGINNTGIFKNTTNHGQNIRNRSMPHNSKSLGEERSRSPEFAQTEETDAQNHYIQAPTSNPGIINPDFSFNDETDGLKVYGPVATKKKISNGGATSSQMQ